jgi:hypothetical protein
MFQAAIARRCSFSHVATISASSALVWHRLRVLGRLVQLLLRLLILCLWLGESKISIVRQHKASQECEREPFDATHGAPPFVTRGHAIIATQGQREINFSRAIRNNGGRRGAGRSMSNVQTPSSEVLTQTISACIANAERLRDESYDLEFREPPSLQLYVLLIAQEELAKAFILLLVRDGIIQFSRPLLRAMNDHSCKQLVGLIMDYGIFRYRTIDEALELMEADSKLGDRLPAAIESAIALLRFEKIGRWESSAWEWEEPPEYESSAKKIAEGKADRRKQDALYVRIGGDGRVCVPPITTPEEIDQEKERLSDFRHLVTTLAEGEEASHRYDKAISVIRFLFSQRV